MQLQATLGPGDAIYIPVCGGMKSNPERGSMDWSITGGALTQPTLARHSQPPTPCFFAALTTQGRA